MRRLSRSVASVLLVLLFGASAPDTWSGTALHGAIPGSRRVESTSTAHHPIAGESVRPAKASGSERDRRAGALFVVESSLATGTILRLAGDLATQPGAVRHSVTLRVSLGRAPPRPGSPIL